MTMKPLDRRTVLRGALATGAAVTIPLPLLDAMLNQNGTALAQSATPLSPLYVTWFFGNGSLPGLWKPAKTGSGSAWDLSAQLTPLADHKSYLTVVSGLDGKLVVGGVEHPTGSAAATTGAPLNGNAVRSESIDQTVAKIISTGTLKSLEIGVTPATPNGPQDSLATVSHGGPNARRTAEYDPKAVFTRLFGGSTATPNPAQPDQAAKLVKVRKSVLDSILQDGARLQQRLGASDKARVEEHLAAIRDLETSLDSTASTGTTPAACGAQTAPTVGKDTKSEAPPEVNTAMSKLATLALSCDKTRVITNMFSLPAAHVYYRHLTGMNDDFHDTICHNDPGDKSTQTRVDTGVQYAMRCLAEFLTDMKNTSYGAGNLLDQTLIYVTSDTGWGKVHDHTEWPVLLIGKGGGKLRGDEHFNYPGENLSRVLLTIAQLMGSTATSYGLDGGKVTAALPGIGV